MRVRVGQGFDVHPFVDDAERPLVLVICWVASKVVLSMRLVLKPIRKS